MKPGDRIPVYVATQSNFSKRPIYGKCFLAYKIGKIWYDAFILKGFIKQSSAKQIGTLIIKKIK